MSRLANASMLWSRRASGPVHWLVLFAVVGALACLAPRTAAQAPGATAAQAPGATAAQAPGATAAASLTRYVPQHDLIACLEFEGLDAHGEAWRKTAAYRLLNNTSMGALLEDLATQVIDQTQQSRPQDQRVPAGRVLNVLKQVARSGLAVALFGKPNGEHVMLVIRKGSQQDVARLMEHMTANEPGQPDQIPAPIQKGGRTVHPLGTENCWWLEKDDLILTDQEGIETVVAVIEGKQPSATAHPLRSVLSRSSEGFEPAAYGFVDMAALPAPPEKAARLGLGGVKRIELQWGFQGEALLTRLHVAAPAPRQGLLGLFDQPTFDAASLPLIPAGRTAFAVLSIDLAKTYDRVVSLLKSAEPAAEQGIDAFENAFRGQLGLNVHNDLLKHLGPKLALYSQESGAAPAENPMAALMSVYTGLTLSIEARDPAELGKQLDVLIKSVNQVLSQHRLAGLPTRRSSARRTGPPWSTSLTSLPARSRTDR